jgi:photosystem II stability/assembly factor-like uncharacterized protein
MGWNNNPRDLWRKEWEWTPYDVQPSFPAYKQTFKEIYNDEFILDSHFLNFNWSKHLCGITFRYIQDSEDIYKKDITVGNDYSIVNYYNPYDLIKTHYDNIHPVDIVCDFNVFLSNKYFKLDDVKIRPGNRILLLNNRNKTTNGVYIVNENYFLTRTSDLESREKSNKYQVYCKSGSYKNKHFYLVPNGSGNFPIDGDNIIFNEGRGLILTNLVNYDLYNGDCKIVFTDPDIARKQMSLNDCLYERLQLNGETVQNFTPLNIIYKDISYFIDKTDNIFHTGLTYDNDQYNIFNYKGETYIKVDSTFTKKQKDYIELNINYTELDDPFINKSYLTLKTFIKEIKDSETFTITDTIPNHIVNIIGATFEEYYVNIISGDTVKDYTNIYETSFIYNDGWDLTNFEITNNKLKIENITGSAQVELWKGITSGSTIKLTIDISYENGINDSKIYLSGDTTQEILDLDTVSTGLTEIETISNENFEKIFIETLTNSDFEINSIKIEESLISLEIDSGVTTYYNFNEFSGNTIPDLLENNDGINYNCVLNENGVYENALEFNGINSYIKLEENLIRNTTNGTISLWFKTLDNGPLLAYQSSDVNIQPLRYVPIFYIGLDGRLRSQLWDGRTNPIISPNVVNDNLWHNIILTYNENEQFIYLDKSLIGQKSGTLNHLDMRFNQLGAGFSRNWPQSKREWWFYKGFIDEFGFWDRQLEQKEVDYIFNNRKGSTYESNNGIGLSDAYKYSYDVRNYNYSDDNLSNFIQCIDQSIFGRFFTIDINFKGDYIGKSDELIEFMDDTYAIKFENFWYDNFDFSGETTKNIALDVREFYSNSFDSIKGQEFELILNLSGLTENSEILIEDHTGDNISTGQTINFLEGESELYSYYTFSENKYSDWVDSVLLWKKAEGFENPPIYIDYTPTYSSMSKDGKYIIMSTLYNISSPEQEDRILISNDYGKTWKHTTTDKNLRGCDISDNGQYITISTANNCVIISNDFGETWQEIYTNDYSGVWRDVAMTPDGRFQYLVGSLVRTTFAYSEDYGQTWTIKTKPNSNNTTVTRSVDISVDGKYVTMVGIGQSTRIGLYVSDDYGNNFDSINTLPDMDLYKISMSKDGKYQLASGLKKETVVIKTGYLYNWYAADLINDGPVSIEPYRLPSEEDFTDLLNHTGSYIGGGEWDCPGLRSLLSILYTEGYRNADGEFNNFGASFWGDAELDLNQLLFYGGSECYLTSADPSGEYYPIYPSPDSGRYIRLVRDADSIEQSLSDGEVIPNDYTGIDGTKYNGVKIGDKIWLKENLLETKYTSTWEIQELTLDADWNGSTLDDYGYYPINEIGARCSYDNDESNAFTTNSLTNIISKDYGETWEILNPTDENLSMGACSVSNDGKIMYISGANRIYKSEDYGENWERIDPEELGITITNSENYNHISTDSEGYNIICGTQPTIQSPVKLENINTEKGDAEIGESLYYNGRNSYTILEEDYINILNSPKSFSIWFKTNSFGVILGEQDVNIGEPTNEYNSILYVNNDFTLQGGFIGDTLNSEILVNDNKWHNAIITVNGTVQKLYLDSVEVASGNTTTGSFEKCQLGTGLIEDVNSWFYFRGYLTEMSYWKKELNSNDIEYIYNNGFGSTYKGTETLPYYQVDFDQNENDPIKIESEPFDGEKGYWYKLELYFLNFINIDRIEIKLENTVFKDISGNTILEDQDTIIFTSIDWFNSINTEIIYEFIEDVDDAKIEYTIYPISSLENKKLSVSTNFYRYHYVELEFDIRDKNKNSISQIPIIFNKPGEYTEILKIKEEFPTTQESFLFGKYKTFGTPKEDKYFYIKDISLKGLVQEADFYIQPKCDKYNKYINYDEFVFGIGLDYIGTEDDELISTESTGDLFITEESGSIGQGQETGFVSFPTSECYIAYKLQPFLYNIWKGFTTGYTIYNNASLNKTEFTEELIGDSMIKIIPNNKEKLKDFKAFTYVKFGLNDTYSIILEKTDDYLILGNVNISNHSFHNVYELGEISDLLHKNYLRWSNNLMIHSYNITKNVYDSYAEILEKDLNIRKYATGIIYRNEQNKYIFKIFNEDDDKLYFDPIEIATIGVEGKYRFPINLENNNFK